MSPIIYLDAWKLCGATNNYEPSVSSALSPDRQKPCSPILPTFSFSRFILPSLVDGFELVLLKATQNPLFLFLHRSIDGYRAETGRADWAVRQSSRESQRRISRQCNSWSYISSFSLRLLRDSIRSKRSWGQIPINAFVGFCFFFKKPISYLYLFVC